jgi:hypothetical protein
MYRTSFTIIILSFILVSCLPMNSSAPQMEEPLQTGYVFFKGPQSDPYYYDGKLPHAVGVHQRQVFRANRSTPDDPGEVGFTYNHQPYLAYAYGKFHLQWLQGQFQEHTPPTRLLLTTSEDGNAWSDPAILFPEYELPEIDNDLGYLPAGTKAVLHQRMGWYVAPNGVLLASGFYSYCPTPRYSPNKGQGLGRVVREVKADGSFGPIYFIRYNQHAGWDDSNTNLPFYTKSEDIAFLQACESFLGDKLATLQWWEEDRSKDGFYIIDPSKVEGEDPTATQKGVTTSAGAGKAFNYYYRKDGQLVAIWKNQWGTLSPDSGKTWLPIQKNSTLKANGAKTWGQQTDDGHYAIVMNHSITRRNRFPMAVLTSGDGLEFNDIHLIHGEVPPQRYQGIHKNPGPQYVRGIYSGNGNPPGDHLWTVYSMNKEDIWINRTEVPISSVVTEAVQQNFENVGDVAALDKWNIYMPLWAPVSIGDDPINAENKVLILADEEPYDYALAERVFPKMSDKGSIHFKVLVDEIRSGSALEIEVVDDTGTRPLRLRLNGEYLGQDRLKVFPVSPQKIQMDKWIDLALHIDVTGQKYDLQVNGEIVQAGTPFAIPVEHLSRLVLRTGPYRGEVPKWLAEKGEPKPAGLYSEDKPGADQPVVLSRFLIDDVVTK